MRFFLIVFYIFSHFFSSALSHAVNHQNEMQEISEITNAQKISNYPVGCFDDLPCPQRPENSAVSMNEQSLSYWQVYDKYNDNKKGLLLFFNTAKTPNDRVLTMVQLSRFESILALRLLSGLETPAEMLSSLRLFFDCNLDPLLKNLMIAKLAYLSPGFPEAASPNMHSVLQPLRLEQITHELDLTDLGLPLVDILDIKGEFLSNNKAYTETPQIHNNLSPFTKPLSTYDKPRGNQKLFSKIDGLYFDARRLGVIYSQLEIIETKKTSRYHEKIIFSVNRKHLGTIILTRPYAQKTAIKLMTGKISPEYFRDKERPFFAFPVASIFNDTPVQFSNYGDITEHSPLHKLMVFAPGFLTYAEEKEPKNLLDDDCTKIITQRLNEIG